MGAVMTCDICGKDYLIGQWPFCPHGWVKQAPSTGNGFPMTTSHITGKPMTFNSDAELQAACKMYGVTHRPDVAWIEKRLVGVERSGKGIYKEGSGMGLPGVWF